MDDGFFSPLSPTSEKKSFSPSLLLPVHSHIKRCPAHRVVGTKCSQHAVSQPLSRLTMLSVKQALRTCGENCTAAGASFVQLV